MNEENGVRPANIASLLGDIAGIQLLQTSAGSGNTIARIQGLAATILDFQCDLLFIYLLKILKHIHV